MHIAIETQKSSLFFLLLYTRGFTLTVKNLEVFPYNYNTVWNLFDVINDNILKFLAGDLWFPVDVL